MKKIRFGVIGCGYISRKAFLPALINSNSAELVAVASRSIERAEAYAEEFNCVPVDNYTALLSWQGIDAVYIATPPSTHKKIILAAAEEGKHVLCEKPLSTSLKNVERIIDTCKKNEITLLELANTVINLTNSNSNIIFNEIPIDDPLQRKPNIMLATHLLNWIPEIELHTGLLKTIKYFKE